MTVQSALTYSTLLPLLLDIAHDKHLISIGEINPDDASAINEACELTVQIGYDDGSRGHSGDLPPILTYYPELRDSWLYGHGYGYEASKTVSLSELQAEWDSLFDTQRDTIYDDFCAACADGAREPSNYWYHLLMPMMLKNYVGH